MYCILCVLRSFFCLFALFGLCLPFVVMFRCLSFIVVGMSALFAFDCLFVCLVFFSCV